MIASGQAGQSLSERTARGIGFRLSGNLAMVLVTSVSGIILARLLPPAQFGLYGLAAATVTVAELIGSCGMLEAAIQRTNLKASEEAAAASVQFAAATLLAVIVFVFAIPLAELLHNPGMGPLLRVQVFILPVAALALIPTIRLSRALEFDKLAAVDVWSRLLAAAVSIGLAFRGWGAMALIVGTLAAACARSATLWGLSRHPVGLRFALGDVRSLFRYGIGILLSGICNLLTRRIDVLMIGARLGVEVVGLYQRAFQLVLLPLEQFMGPINKVLFPAMASVSDEPARLNRGYLVTTRICALTGFPVMTMVWVAGDQLIRVLYGPSWEGTVPILHLLTISGYFRIVFKIHGLFLQASGRAMTEGFLQAIYLILIAFFTYIGAMLGLTAVVTGVILACFLFFTMMTYSVLAISGIPLRAWLGTMRTGALGSVSMAAAIILVRHWTDPYTSPLVSLLLSGAAGAVALSTATRFLSSREDRNAGDQLVRNLPQRLAKLVRLLLPGQVGPSTATAP